MQTIKISDIVIGERQRQKYTGIEDLAESMHAYGQAQPLVVQARDDGMYNLICGGRRLKAAQMNKWTEVEVYMKEDLSAREMRRLELEENLYREDLTPTEEIDALSEFHQLKQEEEGEGSRGRPRPGVPAGWTARDTARIVNKEPSGVSKDLKLAEELTELKELSPKLYENITEGGEVKSKSAMRKALARLVQRKTREVSATERKAKRPELSSMVRQGDSRELIKDIPDESIDLIGTDPPFGVLEDSMRDMLAQRSQAGGLSYHDKPKDILTLLQDLAGDLYRVLVPNSHMYMFCTVGAKDPSAPEEYATFQNIAKAMADAGFAVRPGPLIWVKQMAYGYIPDPTLQFPYCIEGILFARKGSRPFNVKADLDYIIHPPMTRNREHIAAKPPGLWSDILKYSSTKDGVFLDPFCGSGSSLVAAVRHGMTPIGFDLDPNCVSLSTDVLGEEMDTRESCVQGGTIDETEADRMFQEAKEESNE